MDTVLKSFPLQLVFRGVFPGGFFVISYIVASEGWNALKSIGDHLLMLWLPIALFVGVIAYVLHRSVVYPFFESFFDSEASRKARERYPFIRKYTVKRALAVYAIGDREDPKANIARHLVAWNDYVHLQYTSGWCIVAGALFATSGDAKCDGTLMFLTGMFLLGGFFSHWRLCVVVDETLRQYPQTTSTWSVIVSTINEGNIPLYEHDP